MASTALAPALAQTSHALTAPVSPPSSTARSSPRRTSPPAPGCSPFPPACPSRRTILARLAPQVTSQLIDQALELQEINRRNIVVQEADITGAIAHIEQGNGLPPGGLRAKLAAAGVPFDTLVASCASSSAGNPCCIRCSGQGCNPRRRHERRESRAESRTRQHAIPYRGNLHPRHRPRGRRPRRRTFANTVIAQLRAGAPFPIVAAQFSQAQTALQGGDLGFVQLSQLDPAVAAVVTTMPNGAISNPIRVPGGYDIVQLQDSHKVGTDMQTMLTAAPGLRALPHADHQRHRRPGPGRRSSTSWPRPGRNAHSCADIEAVNTALGNVQPADPGPVNLATVTPPAFQTLLANLPIGQVSQPLVAQDGVSIVMICSTAKPGRRPALRRPDLPDHHRTPRRAGIPAIPGRPPPPLDHHQS